jgi:hypothetical protein
MINPRKIHFLIKDIKKTELKSGTDHEIKITL